jgi:hypothetical protein
MSTYCSDKFLRDDPGINGLSVGTLRNILRKHKLPTFGSRVDLCERIKMHNINIKYYRRFPFSPRLPPQPSLPPTLDYKDFLEWILQIQTITGPYTLSVHKLNHKLIFMFGDHHIPTSQECINIPGAISLTDYLDQWFTQSGLCCELFLEVFHFLFDSSFHPSMIPERFPREELSALIFKYNECLTPYKVNCGDFGNVRIHNIDARGRNQIFFPDTMFETQELYQIRDTLQREEDPLTVQNLLVEQAHLYDRWKQTLIDLFQSMLNGDLDHIVELIKMHFHHYESSEDITVDEIIENTPYYKVYKQFMNIPHSDELKQALILHMNNNFPRNISRLAYAPFMDAYAMARLIKTIYQYIDSQVLFLYVGNDHKQIYDYLLTSIYNSKIMINIPPNSPPMNTCIQLTPNERHLIVDALLDLPPTRCRIKY